MKRIIFISLSLITLLTASNLSIALDGNINEINSNDYTSSSTAIDETSITNYFALIIGIEDHNSPLYANDELIDETARDIYNELRNGHNWKKENIRLLLNENASKNTIKNTLLQWLAPLEQEEDIVLIYYVGHAEKLSLQQRNMGTAYLLPYDVETTSYSPNTITDKELDSWIDTLESQHLTVILDTSYSGTMNALHERGRTVIGSTNTLIPKQDTEQQQLGHTIFSHFIIKGLQGYADENGNGYISVEELYTYARTHCIDYSITTSLESLKQFRLDFILQIPSISHRRAEPVRLYSLSFGWKQITDNGFGKTTNYGTRGMEIFNGELYIGTQNNLIPQSQFTEEQAIKLATTGLFPDIYSLLGNLSKIPQRLLMHAMTFVSQGCEIWKYNYTTDTLTKVIGEQSITGMSAGFGSHFNAAAAIMKVFKGHLYVGTWNTPLGSLSNPNRKGCEIWRTADGLRWEQVVGHMAPFTAGGFGNQDNTGAWCIESFNDYLYVGTMNWDFSEEGGCEIWRSSDGVHWEQVVDHGFKPIMQTQPREKKAINTYAWTMKVYKDHLYLGTFNSRVWLFDEEGTGCQLWRTANGVDWEKVQLPDGITNGYQDGFGEGENYGIRRMVIYNDDLYIGIASSFFHAHGCEIWRDDGTTWTPIISDDIPGITADDARYDGFGNPMNKYIWSMCVTNDNKLWVGTANGKVFNPIAITGLKDHKLIDTQTEGFEIWCYDGETWQPIIKNDIGLKPNGLGDASNLGARSMIEYPENSGNIVIGTFKLINPYPGQPREGCELWMRFNNVE